MRLKLLVVAMLALCNLAGGQECPDSSQENACDPACDDNTPCEQGKLCCDMSCGKMCVDPKPREGGGGKGGGRPMGVRPGSDNAGENCDIDTIRNNNVKATLQGFVADPPTKTVSDLVDIAKHVPNHCWALLKEKMTNCGDEAGIMEAKKAINEVKGNAAVIDAFSSCFDEDSAKCSFLVDVLDVDTVCDKCMDTQHIGPASALFYGYGCHEIMGDDDVPDFKLNVFNILYLNDELLENIVEDMTKERMKELLDSIDFNINTDDLGNIPILATLSGISCKKLEIIHEMIEKKFFENFDDLGTGEKDTLIGGFENFLSFLPDEACEHYAMTVTLADYTDLLVNTQWGCKGDGIDFLMGKWDTLLDKGDTETKLKALATVIATSGNGIPDDVRTELQVVADALGPWDTASEEQKEEIVEEIMEFGIEHYQKYKDLIKGTAYESLLQPMLTLVHNYNALQRAHKLYSDLKRSNREEECNFKCGRTLAKKLTEGDTPIVTIPAFLSGAGDLKKCLPNDEITDSAKEGQCQALSGDVIEELSPRDRAKLAKKCRIKNKDAATYTADDLVNLGCTLAEQPPQSFINKVPKEILCADAVLEAVKDCPGANLFEQLSRRCVDGALDAGDKKLGPAIAGVARDKLADMDKDTRKALIGEIKEGIKEMMQNGDRRAKQQARAVAKKAIKNADELENIITDANIMETVAQTEFADAIEGLTEPREALGLNGDLDMQPRLTRGQKIAAFNKIKNSESLDMRDVSADTLQDLQDVLEAVSADDIEHIKENDDLLQIALLLGKYLTTGGRRTEKVLGLLKESLKVYNETNPMTALTLNDVQEFATELIAAMGIEDLQDAGDSVKQEIMNRVSQMDNLRCRFNEQRRQAFAKMIMEIMENKDELQEGDMLKEDGVEMLGQFAEDAEGEILDKLDAKDIKYACSKFGRLQCMSEDFVGKLRTKVAAEFTGGDLDDGENVADLGLCVLFNEVVAKLTDDGKENVGKIVEMLNEHLDPTEEAVVAGVDCCMAEMSDDDKEAVVELWKELKGNLMAILDDIRPVEDAPARRRRREEPALTCEDIRGYGASSTELTIARLSTIEATEFQDCLAVLGGVDWPSGDARKTLYAMVKEHIVTNMDICGIESAHLRNMGTIAYELNTTDINCLDNLDTDVVSALGSLHMWSQEQLEEFADKYMDTMNIASVNAITDIAVMGHFLCGLSKDEIGQINTEVFANDIALVGELKMCGADQLMALYNLAKTSHGSTSDWDQTDTDELGIVIAGVPGADLKNIPVAAMSGIDAPVIAHIHPDHFKHFSKAQIDELSREQAVYITSDQFDELTDEQKEGVCAARAGGDGSYSSTDCIDDDQVTERPVDHGVQVAASIFTILGLIMFQLM